MTALPDNRSLGAETPRCLECDFALVGLPEGRQRCPECGADFDLADVKSHRQGRPVPRLVRTWICPMPAWIAWITLGLAAVLVVWLMSGPGMSYMFVGPILLTLLLAGGLGMAWLGRSASRSVAADAFGFVITPADRERALWRRVWLAVGCLLLIAWLGLPWRLRFWASLPALDRAASEVRTWPVGVGYTGDVGLWRADVLHEANGVVVINILAGGGAGGWQGGGEGFVHLPLGVEMPAYNKGQDGALGGGWRYFLTD